MPTNAQVIQVADACAAAIRAAWDASVDHAPLAAPDGVERVYETPIADPEFLEAFAGRQVWVFPVEYGRTAMSRSQDNRRPVICVIVAERYADGPAPVPTEWLDERVAFVEEVVFNRLADPRKPTIFAGLTPEEDGATVVVYDAELLVMQRLFLSMVQVRYRLQYP